MLEQHNLRRCSLTCSCWFGGTWLLSLNDSITMESLRSKPRVENSPNKKKEGTDILFLHTHCTSLISPFQDAGVRCAFATLSPSTLCQVCLESLLSTLLWCMQRPSQNQRQKAHVRVQFPRRTCAAHHETFW